MLTDNDKVRLLIGGGLLVVGVLLSLIAFSPWFTNLSCPPASATNCGEDGNPLFVLLLLMAGVIVIIGVTLLVLSITYRLSYSKTNKTGTSIVIAVLLVVIITSIVTYILGASSRAETKHTKELTSGLRDKQASFVNYSSAPNFNNVTTISTSIKVKPDYVTLDLFECNPGAGKVTYATGTTYFAISGVQHDKSGGPFDYQCVFYMNAIANNQTWDGILPVKCEWNISSDQVNNNYRGMSVNNNGIDFRDFPLLYCYDTQTNKQSTNPAFNQ